MKLPGSSAFHLGGLLCGVLLGWAGQTLLTAGPSLRLSEMRLRAEAVSDGAGKVDAAGRSESTAEDGQFGAASLSGRISPNSPEFGGALHGALRIADATDRAVRLREILRRIPADELQAAFEKAAKLAGSESWQVLAALGSRWAESDPRAAAEFGMKFATASPDSRFFLHAAMAKWAGLAPGAAARWIEALSPGETRNDLTGTVISAVARTDPQAALAILKSSSNRSPWIPQTLFMQWGRRDPQSAGAAALELSGETGRRALAAVGQSWAGHDPAKALAWAAGLPKPSARKDLLAAIADEWADADPRSELHWVRSLEDGTLRRDETAKGISRLAALDLPAALGEINALPAGEEHDSALRAAAVSAADQDAAGALKLLDQMPLGSNRNDALSELCHIWGLSDPRAALNWQVQNAAPAKNGYMLMETVQHWTGNAPQEAIAWAQALPPGDNRDSALVAVVKGLAETDFARAQMLFDQLSPEAQPNAASALVQTLLSEDIGKARDWAQSLPPGPTQSNAFQSIAVQWADQNPAAAAQWLGTLPAGQTRDGAIGSFSRVAFDRDPEGALAWVQTIDDSADRKIQTAQLVQRWLRTDSTAARAWLEVSPQITPEEKTNILHGN